MKRRRREAGGGEVALMAVITKAMGAFLVLVVIMLPHYVFSPASRETAENAKKSVEQAQSIANEIAEKLKKGRLTDEEIDELLRQIDELTKSLEAAKTEIAALKRQLDQAYSEIARLKKKLEEQEQIIAALKAEIEVLREKMFLTTTVTWWGCPGTQLDLYVQSDKPDLDGKTAPPGLPVMQRKFFNKDDAFRTIPDLDEESGVAVWKSQISLGLPEKLTMYVKNLSPMFHASDTDRCRISMRVVRTSPSDSKVIEYSMSASVIEPVTDTVSIDESGQLTILSTEQTMPGNPEAISLDAFMKYTCDSLLCAMRDKKDAATIKTAAMSYYVGRKGNEEIVSELLSLVMAGKVPHVEMNRLLALLPDKDKGPTKFTPATDQELSDLSALMPRKGVPKSLATAIDKLVRAGEASASLILRKLNARPDAVPTDLRVRVKALEFKLRNGERLTAKSEVESFEKQSSPLAGRIPDAVISELSLAVAQGKVSEDGARELLRPFEKSQAWRQKFSVANDAFRAAKLPGHALQVDLAALVADGKLTVEDVLRLIGSPAVQPKPMPAPSGSEGGMDAAKPPVLEEPKPPSDPSDAKALQDYITKKKQYDAQKGARGEPQ